MTLNDKPRIEVPIEQSEQARQTDPKNLLAQEVYSQIKQHLQNSLARLPDGDAKADSDLDEHRSHEAILIDGGRGTGKSSVLVNLTTYLRNERDFLILKPVDPTLLENGDDLLLNVIVAALMRDKTVKQALHHDEQGAEAFYDQLHKLGAALEGIQTEKSKYGLDKLRSFMSNQALAEQVHELFRQALKLVGKKLVVLPIDDVDTSLSLAYANIEVVRKYLTSPFVIPLISGDLNLYNEIIWRQFHQLLTVHAGDSEGTARQRARDLAEDYQRKVLPLPRRIELPQLTTYLNDPSIVLTSKGAELFPLPVLRDWLEALLNERINGEGNSRQEFPLRTVREMSQFINATRHLILELPAWLDLEFDMHPDIDQATVLKRSLFMSHDIADAVQEFEVSYRKAFAATPDLKRKNRTERERAYSALKRRVQLANLELKEKHHSHLINWYSAIAQYFRYQRKGGATFLSADANVEWLKGVQDPTKTSVLGHDLFQPLNHKNKIFEDFEPVSDVRKTWGIALKGFVPDIWLERLPEKTILAYPVPERGLPINTTKSGQWAFSEFLKSEVLSGKAEFARRLLIHWSFFSSNQRSNLILGGRIFELVVASLVRDLTPTEVMQTLDRAPFYSVAALADTKSLAVSDPTPEIASTRDSSTADQTVEDDDQEDALEQAILELTHQINTWRKDLNIRPPHSWLIYNVMNKFFNQTHYIYSQAPRSDNSARLLRNVVDLGLQAYNSIWAAFGSFEKGEVFGFPRVIANVNMTEASKEFEKSTLYRQNILPFLQNKENNQFFNFSTGSYTYALESHPLRVLLGDIFNDFDVPTKTDQNKNATRTSSTKADENSDYVILGKLFNEKAKNQGIPLKTEIIDTLSREPLTLLLENIYQACTTEDLRSAFNTIQFQTNLSPRTGRLRLRNCLQRYKQLTGKNFSGMSSS